ncbi:MAG TPA: hypothetical protein VN669_03500, partial [Candidatus Acidoferrales bacterium]|nr:hypothetical protein [Candidatus Acidoferrales bacterium]
MNGKLLVALLVAFIAVPVVSAQTQPNLENGWKPYGSYDGSHLDSVNLMNGNLMFHAPILPDQDGRNGLTLRYTLYGSSKDWQARCFFNTSTQLWQCSWVKAGSGLGIQLTPTLMVHRTLNFQFFSGEAPTAEAAYGYTLETADGAVHQLHGVAGTEDANGEPTQFDSIDLSGYHLAVSAPDSEGVLEHVTVTDRSGNQYQGDFTVTLTQSSCPRPSQTTLSAPGNHPPYAEDAPMGDTYCPETVYASLITDSNGNQLSIYAPPSLNPTVDTLGRGTPFKADTTATTDSSGCLGSHPFYESLQYDYQDPDNITRHIKFCYAEVPIQTAFNQPNPHSTGTIVAEAATGVSGLHFYPVTTVILGDGTTWAFDYDSYGELSYIGLPTGGSISYGWQTVPFESCDSLSDTRRSRAVQTRTFNDGQGHSFLWQYQWGAHTSSGFTNTVTDPAGNDTEHIFSEQGPAGSGCHFYETSTIQYQGAKGAGQPLQRVDTGYSSQSMSIDETINTTGLPGLGNVFATDVTTTVYSNGNPTKVKLVHRDPDSGLGPGLPIFGNTIRELDYDWGDYPSHGPLLRETDTTYKWQIDSRYLTAGLLDLPAYVSMIDPKAGSSIKSDCHGWDSTLKATLKACASETSYLYDEFGLQPNDGGIPAGTLVAAPHSVRGNLTTVSRWL